MYNPRKRISDKRTKNQAKTDKTKHGIGGLFTVPLPSPEPPPDHWSTTVNSDQRQSTAAQLLPDHQSMTVNGGGPPLTIDGPLPDYRSTTGQQW
ncbi:hypothetical protein Tco_1438051 [Tanacetum coccineum]